MTIKSILVGFVCALIGCAFWYRSPPVVSKSPIVAEHELAGNDVISGYRKWTRVNPEPFDVEARQARLCGRPFGARLELEQKNPHRNKFVVVYVNNAGKSAMMDQKSPVFPVGSVIVKEKLPAKDSTAPELLTVMRKREASYDPDKGNWEYMVFDGAGQTVKASGKLNHCQSCHLESKANDYVVRTYFPYDRWQKMK